MIWEWVLSLAVWAVVAAGIVWVGGVASDAVADDRSRNQWLYVFVPQLVAGLVLGTAAIVLMTAVLT